MIRESTNIIIIVDSFCRILIGFILFDLNTRLAKSSNIFPEFSTCQDLNFEALNFKPLFITTKRGHSL